MPKDLFSTDGSATVERDLFAPEDPPTAGVEQTNAAAAVAPETSSPGILEQLGQNLMEGPLTGPVIRAVRDATGYALTTPPMEQLGDLARFQDNSMRAMASGATFGFADELAAAANTATGLGADSYEENVAAERARDAQIPMAQRIPGEIAGGLATGGVAGTALRGTQAAQALSRLPKFLQAAGTGGVYGGAYGAGTSEGDLAERLPDAARGAAIGAAAGGTLNLAGQAIGATGRAGQGFIQNRTNPQVAANNQMSQALTRDQMSPAQVSARLKRLGPQATLADAGGENLRSLARATAGVPGPAKEKARSVFNMRAFGEGSRVQEAVKSGTKAQNYFASRDQLLGTLRGRAGPMYQKAYEAGPNLQSKKLNELLNRDVSKSALREAQELAAIDGRAITVPPKGIATETLDDLKRGFDSMIDQPAYKNQLTGELNKKGTALKNLKNQILDEADRLNPAYREARMAYKGDAEMLDALNMGTKFKRMPAEEVRRTLAELTPAEQQAFRNGAAKDLLIDINKTGDTRSVAQKFGNREMREKMRALISDPQEFRDFTRLLIQEGRFQNTRNMVLGGSQTAPRQAELADMAGGVAADMATGQGATIPIMRRVMESINRPNADVASRLSPALFTRGQQPNQQTLQRLNPMSQALRERIQEQLARSQGIGAATLLNQRKR